MERIRKIQALHYKIEKVKRRLKEVEESAEGTTSHFNGQPRAKAVESKVEKTALSAIELQGELEELEREFKEAVGGLKSVMTGRELLVCLDRYVYKRRSWETAEVLGLSERTVRRLFRQVKSKIVVACPDKTC